MQKPIVVSSRPVFDGKVIKVSVERLRYSNGREYDLDYARHPGAAAVVALDAQERVCVVRQYRHGVEDFLWEIPAGKLDPGEAPAVCAHRELTEETGVVATRWTELGLFIPAPAIMTEVIHLYLARDLNIGASRPDEDEELELWWLPFKEALHKVQSGEWNDGKTGHALLRTQYQMQL